MRNAILLLFLIIFGTACAFGQKAAGGKVDPSKGVREAFDRLVDGIKQVDADKVMNLYEKSERLLIFNNNGTATQGWSNIDANTRSVYAKLKNVSLDITGLRIEMIGTTGAYVSCKWRQTQENEGKLEDASGRMTLVYRLIGKDWKIVHRHTSPDNPAATRPVFPSERQ